MTKITFKYQNEKEVTVNVTEELSVLQIAHDNDINLEGACEGSLACSTCHVVIPTEWFKKLDAPEWDEEDMLDFVANLTPNSRLGCQILLTEKLDGLVVHIPDYHHDIRKNKR